MLVEHSMLRPLRSNDAFFAMTQSSSTYRRWTRRLAWMLGLGSVLALGWLGWQWQSSVTVSAITIDGTEYADEAELADLARVDSGDVLYDVKSAFVADRVQRHPWVEEATVTRRPTGTLRIAVTERTPAVLAIDEGTPAFYVDRDGFTMPLLEETVHDVPLLYGLEGEHHPVRPIDQATLRDILYALEEAPAQERIAEIELRAGDAVEVRTRPTEQHGSIRVRLGTGDYAAKLNRLDAFWEQAVATQPEVSFEQIDLRFDNQIVARQDE